MTLPAVAYALGFPSPEALRCGFKKGTGLSLRDIDRVRLWDEAAKIFPSALAAGPDNVTDSGEALAERRSGSVAGSARTLPPGKLRSPPEDEFRIMRQLAIRLAVAAAVLGCQPESRPESQPETASPGADGAAAPPQFTLVEDVRIGSLSDPDIGFTNVGRVAVGPDRRMYVAERQDRQMRIYDAAGNLERVVGRRGQGPGEFQSMTHLGLFGDTVWVVDLLNARITLFNRDGDLVETMRAPRISVQRGTQSPMYLRADRNWVSGAGFASVPIEGVSYTVSELLFDASGALVDTLRNVERVTPPLTVTIDSVSILSEDLLQDDPIVSHDPGTRTVIVRGAGATSDAPSTFSVTSISVSGDTVFDTSFEYRPIPVSDTYVDRVVESFVAGAQAQLGAGRFERALRSALPPFHPPVTQVRFGEDRAIWLRRESDRETEARYWILEPDGSVRGVVTLPSAVRIMWSGIDELVGMELDGLDVPWLIRYRLQRGSASD
jgi:hypothetical protein